MLDIDRAMYGDDTKLENLWICWTNKSAYLLSTERCTRMIPSLKSCKFTEQDAYYQTSNVCRWYQAWKSINLLRSIFTIDSVVSNRDNTEPENSWICWAVCCYWPSSVWRLYWAWKFVNLLNSMLAIDQMVYKDDIKPEKLRICWAVCLLLTERCMEMISSQKIKILLSKQISMLVINQAVYGDDTESENSRICWTACLLSTEWCMWMILSLKICKFAEKHACYWSNDVWQGWYRVWKSTDLLSSMFTIDQAV